MNLPPDLLVAAPNVTTSATINTTTTGTLVAAPGVGFRFRLWLAMMVPDSTVQAVVNWRALVNNGPGGAVLVGNSGNNFASSGPIWIPGGLALLNNTAIGYNVQSALASMVLRYILGYTLEAA